MSDELHPDLDQFYDALSPDDDGTWGDDPDDPDYEYGVDDDDIYIEGDDDDEYIDDDEDEEEDSEDEDEDMDVDEEGEEEGREVLVDDNGVLNLGDADDTTLTNIAAILNAPGSNNELRQSLLARLLSGPRSASGGFLRRLGGGGGGDTAPRMSVEERRKRDAARRKKNMWWTPQTEPHPRGVTLLKSGEFGKVGQWKQGKRVRRLSPRFDTRMRKGLTSASPEVSPLGSVMK